MALTDEQVRLAAKFLHSRGYRGKNNRIQKIAKPYPLPEEPGSVEEPSTEALGASIEQITAPSNRQR